MANRPDVPGSGIAPGVVTPSNQNKYPQWGVSGINSGSKIIQANNGTDKLKDIGLGYVVWFADQSDATSYAQSEQNNFTNGTLGLGTDGCNCLLSLPFGVGCIFTKTETRAMIGGLVILGAGVLALGGIAVLAAYGLNHTGAGNAITKSVGAVRAVPFIP